MKKITLSLIHNFDQRRLGYVRRRLDMISTILKDLVFTSKFEVAYQGNSLAFSSEQFCERELIIEKIIRQWDAYLERSSESQFVHREPTEFNLLKAGIEAALTDKHIRSWDIALEGNSDYLMSFEDDVIISNDAARDCYQLVGDIVKKLGNQIYIDLAGGFPLTRLNVQAIIAENSDRVVLFRKPVTNTTCSYLCDRELLVLAKNYIFQNPACRLLPIDWLLNNIFVSLYGMGERVTCMHFDPPIFIHGSMNGNYATMVQL
jgi:hypothetical protein